LTVIPSPAAGCPAARPRHRDVHEDERRHVVARPLDRLRAILSLDDDVAGVGQDVHVQGTLVGIVIRDEDRATGRRCQATKLTRTRAAASPLEPGIGIGVTHVVAWAQFMPPSAYMLLSPAH